MAGILYPTSSTFVVTFLSWKVYSVPYALPPAHPINPNLPTTKNENCSYITLISDLSWMVLPPPKKTSHGELRIQISVVTIARVC